MTRIWIGIRMERIGLAPWIRIRIGLKSWIHIRYETNVDPKR
jgi:hypothetical protein